MCATGSFSTAVYPDRHQLTIDTDGLFHIIAHGNFGDRRGPFSRFAASRGQTRRERRVTLTSPAVRRRDTRDSLLAVTFSFLLFPFDFSLFFPALYILELIVRAGGGGRGNARVRNLAMIVEDDMMAVVKGSDVKGGD